MTNGSEGIAEYPGRREALARAYDPEAFEDHPIERRSTIAAIQWAARRKLATDAAERIWPAVEALVAENSGQQSAKYYKRMREAEIRGDAIQAERDKVRAERDALREQLAAAEALIWEMGDATDIRHGGKLDRLDRIAMLAAGYPRSKRGDRG